MNSFEKMNAQLRSLVIFRGLLEDKALTGFFKLLESLWVDPLEHEQADRYSSFVSEVFRVNCNFTEYIRDRILEDDNFYIAGRGEGRSFPRSLEECLVQELELLREISQIDADKIRSCMKYKGFLPAWETSEIDFKAVYENRMKNLVTQGYGIYSKFHMFTLRDGAIVPVKSPDATRLSYLKGYGRERQAVIDNTLALLQGNAAANVLLYGDAGTGKSSTVKAIANEYKDRGLRLIEVRKNQLYDIPAIIGQVSGSCLKFILFIDDLSFTKNSDDFGALKAALEGSVTARPGNVAIYATSNRRHLIKETFSERDGDDIHVSETIQEMVSLSERFGLVVNFEKPDKEQYLDIVRALGREYKIEMSAEELEMCAERYALIRSGRSPRIARQLMERLVNETDR